MNISNQYVIEHNEEAKIKNLLMFRKIVKVDGDTLVLDNGTELTIIPNVGCGGCSSGNYDIVELNSCENVITNVEITCEDTDDWGERSYKIFVFAEDKRILAVQVDGDDGNGYYGTGYEIEVKVKE